MISNFLRYTFLGQVRSPSRTVVIDDLSQAPPDPPKANSSAWERSRSRAILTINWVIAIVCLVSFSVIVFYSLFLRDEAIPDIMQNTFSSTLGWFGSAFASFLEKDTR